MNKKIYLVGGLMALAFILSGCSSSSDQTATATPTVSVSPAINQTEAKVDKKAIIKTAAGNIEVGLYTNVAPNTVANFLKKASDGFYNNLTFHRVEDWVIQGGDPKGDGTGGENQPTELSNAPFKAGSLGVARAGDINVSNDSQFFICKTDCSWLNSQYTNFGEVISGMDVVNKIAIGDKITGIAQE